MSIEYTTKLFKRYIKVQRLFRKICVRKFARNFPENLLLELRCMEREHAFWEAPGIYHVNYVVFVFDMFDLQFSMLQSCLYKQI